MVASWYFVGSRYRPLPVRCNGSAFALKMHSTTEFAMTVLNECVWFCVKWISWTVGLHRAVNMAALNLKMAAPPAVALVQSLVKIKRKNNRYLRKIAMLFGAAPSAKNTDFTARLRHLPSLFFFCAIYYHSGVMTRSLFFFKNMPRCWSAEAMVRGRIISFGSCRTVWSPTFETMTHLACQPMSTLNTVHTLLW